MTTAAIRHLHEFVMDDAEWCPEPRLTDPFWGPRSPGYRQVTAWLTDGRAAAAVEAAFDAETREDVLRLLDEIHAVVAPS